MTLVALIKTTLISVLNKISSLNNSSSPEYVRSQNQANNRLRAILRRADALRNRF
nr:hypothetical protein [uncultured Pedobacter sp.]